MQITLLISFRSKTQNTKTASLLFRSVFLMCALMTSVTLLIWWDSKAATAHLWLQWPLLWHKRVDTQSTQLPARRCNCVGEALKGQAQATGFWWTPTAVKKGQRLFMCMTLACGRSQKPTRTGQLRLYESYYMWASKMTASCKLFSNK